MDPRDETTQPAFSASDGEPRRDVDQVQPGEDEYDVSTSAGDTARRDVDQVQPGEGDYGQATTETAPLAPSIDRSHTTGDLGYSTSPLRHDPRETRILPTSTGLTADPDAEAQADAEEAPMTTTPARDAEAGDMAPYVPAEGTDGTDTDGS